MGARDAGSNPASPIKQEKMRTKKTKSVARFGARYGKTPKERVRAIEEKQRKKQLCPFCHKKAVKRISKGLYTCKACGKRFTSSAFYVEK